jgi:catechol-2,3-dioxygenase
MSDPEISRVVPSRMAHFVIRTNRYAEMVEWYKTVFEASLVFANDALTFLGFDEEHHRIAIINMPALKDITPAISAIDHVAFTYSKLGELLSTYLRLRNLGIVPAHTLNHGPTTSFYYVDPNDNMIELQVDNFRTSKEAAAYFRSTAFADNPIGTVIDPELLLSKWRANVPDFDLLRPGNVHLA